MNTDDLLKQDTKRLNRQDTLQDGMFSKIAEAEALLGEVGGEKHHVLFIGEDVMNCRKLAGMLNMQSGFSSHYEQYGEKIDPGTGTIVLATHNPEVLARVKEKANGAEVVVMCDSGVPAHVGELFPEHFVAWNFPAAFGHITKASKVVS